MRSADCFPTRRAIYARMSSRRLAKSAMPTHCHICRRHGRRSRRPKDRALVEPTHPVWRRRVAQVRPAPRVIGDGEIANAPSRRQSCCYGLLCLSKERSPVVRSAIAPRRRAQPTAPGRAIGQRGRLLGAKARVPFSGRSARLDQMVSTREVGPKSRAAASGLEHDESRSNIT